MKRVFPLLAACALAVSSGCGDFNKAMNTERKPVSPPGILPVDQMSTDPTSVPPASATPAPGTAAANGTPAAAAPTQPPAPDPNEVKRQSIIAKTTAVVVDKKKAMAQNPNLVEIANSAQGGDPISFAASAYITIRARASTLGIQNELKNFKALNERNPTHEELTQMMKQHGIEFAMLPAWQMYGYDTEKGTLCVLEDKADKSRRYKEAGIPEEK